jgi:hypothetical protein
LQARSPAARDSYKAAEICGINILAQVNFFI